jgi:integrase/recombinase XerD
MHSPSERGETEVRQFLLHLAQERKITPGLQKTYASALKFLYRITLRQRGIGEHLPFPNGSKTFPVILKMQDALILFTVIRSTKYTPILVTAYGAGVRISEVYALKTTDINSQCMFIHVRLGKRNKDRYVLLGKRTLGLFRDYYKIARPKGVYLFPE